MNGHVDQRQMPDAPLAQGVAQPRSGLLPLLALQLLLKRRFLFRAQETGLCRAVVEPGEGKHPGGDRHQPLDHKHPEPARMAEKTVHLQQRAGKRRAEGQRQRRAHIKQAHYAGALLLRKPLRGEIDHAGEKARFGRAKQGTHQQEFRFAVGQRHRRGEHAPEQRSAANPAARAEAAHQQVGGHAEQRIDHKEDACAQRISLVAQSRIELVRLFGEADIGAVQKRQHVKHQHKRN